MQGLVPGVEVQGLTPGVEVQGLAPGVEVQGVAPKVEVRRVWLQGSRCEFEPHESRWSGWTPPPFLQLL